MKKIEFEEVQSEWEKLFEDLSDALNSAETEGNVLQIHARKIYVCKEYLNKLKLSASSVKFDQTSEEIHFFKVVKPKFYSQLIYHHKLYNILLEWPQQEKDETISYINLQIQKTGQFIKDNRFLSNYYYSNETSLDQILFVRQTNAVFLPLQLHDLNTESSFTTQYGDIISFIQANARIAQYLLTRLEHFDEKPDGLRRLPSDLPKVVFTGQKVGLLEVLLGLYEDKAFNNGTLPLKDLVAYMNYVLNTNIENYSRTEQEILSRKSGYVNYLKHLMTRVINRFDRIEKKYEK